MSMGRLQVVKLTINLTKAKAWNFHFGCSPISTGCDNCRSAQRARDICQYRHYSEADKDFYAKGENAYYGTERDAPTLIWHKLYDKSYKFHPCARKKPTVYWVDDMSDLFHPQVSEHDVDAVLDTAASAPQHLFLVLTKRPRQMCEYADRLVYMRGGKFPANLWFGVSVENRACWVERVPLLRRVAGVAKRFVAVEPFLEDLGGVPEGDLTLVDWVLCGGEVKPWALNPPYGAPASGRSEREKTWTKPEWVHSLWAHCRRARVPFYFLRLGSHSVKMRPFYISRLNTNGDQKFLQKYAKRPGMKAVVDAMPYFFEREHPDWEVAA